MWPFSDEVARLWRYYHDNAPLMIGTTTTVIVIVAAVVRYWKKISGLIDHATGRCAANVAELSRQRDEAIRAHAVEVAEMQRQHEECLSQEQAKIAQLTEELEQAAEQGALSQRAIASIRNRYKRAVTDRIWLTQPVGRQPEFYDLGEFKTPVISFFNLKGGVGKTTLCANLAATYWSRGERILLIDLDYQASLTCHCLTPQQIEELNFLQSVPSILQPVPAQITVSHGMNQQDSGENSGFTKLIKEMQRPVGRAGSYILPTSESLDQEEVQLMIRWVFGQTKGQDLRFHLRSLLHRPEMIGRFDKVFIDCPPRLTTASVNALAASHFTIVPVLPDVLSTNAVPRLLKHVDRFQSHGVSKLKVLGVVANRAYNANGLSAKQRQRWHIMSQKVAPGLPMTSFIPNTVNLQTDAEEFHSVPQSLRPFFNDLADEVDQRIKQHASF